ncbi:MAG TPA: fused MFS/spermidine synthase [Rhizomicrobium sp.]|nr:fused MFS/spermidine synthase [Rhizomicrobium sp.]
MSLPGQDPRYSSPVIEQVNASGAVTYWRDSNNQSSCDAQGISLADYIHAMFGFLRQAGCRDVLMIGCGGGTLATMLHRAGVRVVMVDIDPLSFQVARGYFHMPSGIECHAADGAAFLRRRKERYHAIVVDAFADGVIPRQLLTQAFFAVAKRRLRPRRSLLLLNVIVASDDDRTPDRIACTMKTAWRNVRILDSDGWLDRNAIIAAGAVRTLRRPKLLMPPARGAGPIAKALRELTFRAIRWP